MTESEAQTRRKIDAVLEACGWRVVPYQEGKDYSLQAACAITEFPTENGPADYVLAAKGELLAIVEAKKVALGVQSVLSQAQRYAKGIKPHKYGDYGVPFAYSSNGNEFYFQDLRETRGYSRAVAKFHTVNGLREMQSSKQADGLAWLKANARLPARARPYQAEAINATEKALASGKRRMLVAMATGTGKTFAMAAEIYRLMKSGYAKRILFLVDRRALAAQAVREFATFEAEPGKKFDQIYEVYSQRFRREDFDEEDKFDPKVLPQEYLENPKLGNAFVYVSTIQRMRMNIFHDGFDEEEPSDDANVPQLDIPIHAFDVIIADECHRGYTAAEVSKWRQVLDHFDAVKIGLTATPAEHTTAYFHDIIYRYGIDRAVAEGYLVDYDAVTIDSKVKLKGLFLKQNELVGLVDRETGLEKLDNVEDEREFESSKIEREITSPDSTRKIVKELCTFLTDKEKELGHFPKALVFAVQDMPHTSHADRLVNALREELGRGDKFVQKITGTVDRPLQEIRKFRNRPEPGVVVTVDMLSTGVDIPALEAIVFLRPVQSRILFTQMLGRGTRRCDAINKTRFWVFDCFGGSLLEYFKNATEFTADPPDKPTRTTAEVIDSIYRNKDRDYNTRCLVRRLQRVAKDMDGEAVSDFAHFIPKGDVSQFAQALQGNLKSNFVETIGLLRDAGFQKLLLSYPRKQRIFLIAYDTKDEVSSELVFRTVTGDELKPPDYIAAFEEFIKKNPDKVEAIRILLARPKDWGTDALSELEDKLEHRPEKFTRERLRKAYHNELADIISLVKYAAKKEPSLLSAEERVERAMARLTKGKKFTAEQEKWLGLIKAHLVQNLAISEQDLQEMQIFARAGGLRRANAAFGGGLPALLKQVNEEMAK